MQEKMEILAKLEGLENLFNEKFDVNEKGHQDILEQVKKTNNRTTKLEEWKNQLIGAWRLALFLGVTNIVVLVIFVYKIIIR